MSARGGRGGACAGFVCVDHGVWAREGGEGAKEWEGRKESNENISGMGRVVRDNNGQKGWLTRPRRFIVDRSDSPPCN